MDTTAQQQDQTNTNQPQAQPAVRTPLDNAPVQQPQPQVQPVPTGSMKKEAEMAQVSDYLKPSEPELIRDQEVAEAGIEEAEKELKVEEEHEKMGIKPSLESTPVKTEPTGTVQLPMTPEEIKQEVKKGPGIFNFTGHYLGIYFTSSRDFLAALLNKLLKRRAEEHV